MSKFSEKVHNFFYLKNPTLWIFAGFLCMITFTPGKNVFTNIWASYVLSRQEKQIEKYKEDINRMDLKIESLSYDKDTLERFARENYYFCAPDEDIYILKTE